MNWAKAHWIVLVCVLVPVLALPAAWYFSNDWNESIVKKAKDEVSLVSKDLTGAKINYTVPGLVPGTPATEFAYAPNDAVIKHFDAQRKAQAEDAGTVIEKTLAVAKSGRKALIEGLFPEPNKQEETTKRREFSRAFFSDAFPALLTKYRAGPPPKAIDLAADLAALATDLRAKSADAQNQVPPDLQKENDRKLWQDRVLKYQRRSRELAFYADESSFVLPALVEEPSLREAYDLQQVYWLNDEVLAIVAAANAGAANPGVPGAVVKRVVSVTVDPLVLPTVSGDPAAGGGGAAAPAGTGEVTTDFKASITGRVGNNSLYDIRTARVVLIVSTERQPMVLDAISRNRFASVLDYDVEAITPLDDLKLGYYYGEENCVRVSIKLETIWLRDFMKDFMPPDVKAAYGIAAPAPADAPAGTPPAAGGRG
jgi:hypothetical protein